MTLPDAVTYIVQTIPWSVAGFLLGSWSQSRFNPRSRPMTSPLSEGAVVTAPRTGVDGSDAGPWYKNSRTWIGLAVALIGLVTGIQWFLGGAETRRVADETHRLAQCQSAYANGFADALDARTKESTAVADGQDGMWLLFQEALNTAPSPDIRERFRVQLDTYFSARAKTKAAQVENPFPPAPRDLCK
jgi:hypothetical protein